MIADVLQALDSVLLYNVPLRLGLLVMRMQANTIDSNSESDFILNLKVLCQINNRKTNISFT